MQQLERAIAVYEEWLAAGMPVVAADLVAAHPDLAELLSALVADRTDVERSIAAVGGTPQRVLGDFVLRDEIGRGGMGVVYRARQRSLDREVALKVLPQHVTLQPSAVARFKREALLAARVEHPGIVQILAVGSSDDAHWFAMELIDGRPLSRRDPQTGTDRTVRQAVELCARVGDALAHAHAHGVLHRDVKPSNILVTAEGRPVLTDFGLARDVDAPGITRTGAFTGTPHYTSPEQAAGRDDVDARTDVWALGVTLYELVTGRRPFEGASAAEVFAQVARAEPPDPLRITPDLAPDLAAILGKALEKDPARRYASAAEFTDDLRAFLEFRPVAARRAGPLLRLQRWVRREPLRAVLAATLAVGVPALGVLAGYLLSNRTAIEVGAEELRRHRREERLARLTIDLEAGDYDAALQSGDRAIAEDPQDVEAHVLRALVGVYAGRGEQALAELDAAIAARGLPHRERARAVVLVALGRDADATAAVASAPAEATPEALFLEAKAGVLRASERMLDPPSLRAICDTLLQAMMVSPTPRLHYYLQYSAALGWTGDAAAVARANTVLLHNWPDSPAAQLYVAFALRVSDPRRAADLYRNVIAAGYEHPRLFTSMADCLGNAGDAAGAAAARSDGLRSYEARERSGRLADTDLLNFVIQLKAVGRDVDAEERVRAVVQRRPENARAQRILGWLLTERNDLAGAVAALEAAVRIEPANGDGLQRLASARLAAGDVAGALADYERLCVLLPGSPRAHAAKAAAQFRAEDFAAAAATLRRAIELQPREPGMHHDLGVALRRLGDKEGALAAFRTAVELRPDYGLALVQLGSLQRGTGEREAGNATLRRFLPVASAVDAIPVLLEIAAEVVTDGDDGRALARSALERALALGPSEAQRVAIDAQLALLGAAR